MIKALKVVMIVFGVVEILLGLMLVAMPEQTASPAGAGAGSGFLLYYIVSLGVCLIVPSIFIIIAAQDPLKHINWVKFAIVFCLLGSLAGLYAVIRGYVTFGEAGMQIIMDAVFGVVFLALYPYRAAKGS